MYENTLELYTKNDDISTDGIVNCLFDNGWISNGHTVEGHMINFISGDYDVDFRVSLYGDYISVEGNNSYEVVEIWNQLKSIAL